MLVQDIKIQDKTVIHDGFLQLDCYKLQQRCFSGDWTSAYTRELIVKPRAVAVLPYDSRLDQVVLIEQFRIGALASQNTTPWLIEIVAGIMDQAEDESYEDVARREMREEIGLEIEVLLPIYEYFTTPGCSTEMIKLFCAKVDSTKAPQFSGLKQEHEDIKIHLVSTKEAFEAVRLGQINNGMSIIALQWLELNLEMVNSMWK